MKVSQDKRAKVRIISRDWKILLVLNLPEIIQELGVPKEAGFGLPGGGVQERDHANEDGLIDWEKTARNAVLRETQEECGVEMRNAIEATLELIDVDTKKSGQITYLFEAIEDPYSEVPWEEIKRDCSQDKKVVSVLWYDTKSPDSIQGERTVNGRKQPVELVRIPDECDYRSSEEPTNYERLYGITRRQINFVKPVVNRNNTTSTQEA